MCIFQTEQLIELRFWLKITSLKFKSPDLNPLDYHVRCNTRTLYAKTNQHCRAEDCLASIWNDLPQEFIDKAILLFRKTSILCYCSWRTIWTLSLNTESEADIHYWNVLSIYGKVVQSLIRY